VNHLNLSLSKQFLVKFGNILITFDSQKMYQFNGQFPDKRSRQERISQQLGQNRSSFDNSLAGGHWSFSYGPPLVRNIQGFESLFPSSQPKVVIK